MSKAPGTEGLFPQETEDYLRRKVKTELRKRMRGVRNATPASACALRSERIVERVLALPFVASARAVALFYPIEDKHEVDLRGLDAALRGRGVTLAYPAIAGGDGAMTFRWVSSLTTLEEQGYGFAEPPLDAPEATTFDVILVPALAVDGRGHRIGYGAGYYDRALPRYVPPAVSVVVAFDFQLVSEVPVTEGDIAAEWVVTDARAERSCP